MANKILKPDSKAGKKKAENNKLAKLKDKGQALILQDYTENFPAFVEQRRAEFAKLLDNYKDKLLDNGVEEDKLSSVSTLEISRALGTPFINAYGASLAYSPEQLIMANDFYWESVSNAINKGFKYVPTIQEFCSLLGISTLTLIRSYASNTQEQMREAVQIIKDSFSSYYIQCGMKREYSEVMAIFTMKSSLGMRDNEPPITIINNTSVLADEQSVEKFRQKLFGGN